MKIGAKQVNLSDLQEEYPDKLNPVLMCESCVERRMSNGI
jgi:hypothetical protein